MLVELPQPIFKAAIERLSVLNESGKVKLDAYTHIRLETLPGGLLLSAYNRMMRAEIAISEVRHDGFQFICGLPLQQVKDLCATLPEMPTLTLELDQTSCLIRCGSVRFKTKILLEDAFPKAQQPEGEPRKVNLKTFFLAMGMVSHCADPASQRQYAHGLLFTKKSICATDGMRVAKVDDHWIKPHEPIAITMDSVSRMQKLFKGYADGGLLLGETELIIIGGGVRAAVRLAAWKIPRVEDVIPKGDAPTVRIEKGFIEQALSRALIVTDEKAPQTTISFAPDGIRIFTEEDGQVAEDLIPIPCPAPSRVTINPRYLLDAIKSVEGESAVIELRGPEFPLVIKDMEGSHVNAIMPLQSSN